MLAMVLPSYLLDNQPAHRYAISMNTSKILLSLGTFGCLVGVIALPINSSIGGLLLLAGILSFAGGRLLQDL